MNRTMRYGLFVIGIVAAVLTVGFFFQMSWATSLWPWPDGRLSYIFYASITAAVAGPMIWMALSGERAAALGGAVNLTIQGGGMAIFIAQLASATEQTNLLPWAIGFGIFALINFATVFWASRAPIQDHRPTPAPVAYSFAVFIVALFLMSSALLLKFPVIFPWPLKPETSVMIGWVFAGTVVYFAYSLVVPQWGNAKGQLLGFLFYDLILIVPFLQHFATVLPEHRLSLTLYTGVLIWSGLLAIFYLFIHPKWRLWAKIEPAARPPMATPTVTAS